MIIDLQSNKTIVNRLRITSAGADPNLAQLRMSSLLSSASFHSAQDQPSAIVFIRTFRDPLPGVVRLDQGGGRLPAAWDKAAKEAIHRLTRAAVRPALGSVPPGAEAVVFIDRSELLACLASDWSEGNMMTHWWWQSLLKQGAASQIVKELWRRDPRYVPAALQQLASKNKATDFVRALSVAEVRELLRGVAQSFALPALIRVLDFFETSANADQNSVNPAYARTAARGGNDGVSLTTAAPWRAWVPECRTAELQPEQELFFGVALMLQRAPLKARAPEFQACVREWQQEIWLARVGKGAHSGRLAGQTATPSQNPRDSAILDERLRHSSIKQSDSVARAEPQMNEAATAPRNANDEVVGFDSAPVHAGAEVDDVAVEQFGLQSQDAETADAELRPRASQPTEVSEIPSSDIAKTQAATPMKPIELVSESMAPTISSQPSEKPAAGSALPIVTGEAAPRAAENIPPPPYDETPLQLSATVAAEESQPEEWIETRFGGAFYLINLGLALGLYGDFTTPDEPGIQLSIWDFVALLAHELVSDDVVNDPLWPLLQQLAQREEGELLGAGFELEEVSSFEFRVSGSEFRVSSLELDDALGLETAAEQRSPKLETRNSKLETSSEPETRNSKLETSPAVVAWLDRLMPYVRTRLRQALGLSEADDPGPLVCRQRARVYLTPTHLDVFFYLAELPIEIRLAGLDRNPGWVPAAGRFIAFHFE